MWSPDGKELDYVAGDAMMAVAMQPNGTFGAAPAVRPLGLSRQRPIPELRRLARRPTLPDDPAR
jgi:hypothetical protein